MLLSEERACTEVRDRAGRHSREGVYAHGRSSVYLHTAHRYGHRAANTQLMRSQQTNRKDKDSRKDSRRRSTSRERTPSSSQEKKEKKVASTRSWFGMHGPSPFGRWNGSGNNWRGRKSGKGRESDVAGVFSNDVNPLEGKENDESTDDGGNDGGGAGSGKGPVLREHQRVRHSSWQSVRSLMGL